VIALLRGGFTGTPSAVDAGYIQAVSTPAPTATSTALPFWDTGTAITSVPVVPVVPDLRGRSHFAPDPPTPTVKQAQAWALKTLGVNEYDCLWNTVWQESKWDPLAWNHEGSGAYGLPQAKPGSKMASFGIDWQTNPITQLKWTIWYEDTKYGGVCQAEQYRAKHGFY